MDKNTETLMTWALTIGVPILMLQIQEIVSSRKQRIEIAISQARRGEAIADDITQLKNTVEKSSNVLDGVRDDLSEVRQRLARVETKINL